MPKLITTRTRIADLGKPRIMNWLWSYFSYDKRNRLIIARPKDGIQ